MAPNGTTIGSPLNYTLKLKLPPSINFYDTTVEDQLPQGVAYDATGSITCTPDAQRSKPPGTALTPKVSGSAQLLGWYFGNIEAAAVERTVTITYTAHVAQELEAGKKVLDKQKLKNEAIGLYSGEAKLKAVPTEPPPRGEFTNKTNEPNAKTKSKSRNWGSKRPSPARASPPTKTQPGDEYTYTLKVTNSGDAPAYDVVVKDDNPQGVLREVNRRGSKARPPSSLAGWRVIRSNGSSPARSNRAPR